MTDTPPRRGMRWLSHETRLLLLTIVVSAAVLVLLGRMRFPERRTISDASPVPLEHLAATASYEQLARIVAQVQRRIAPDLVVVRAEPLSDASPRTLDELMFASRPERRRWHVPALRLGNGTAIASVDPHVRLTDLSEAVFRPTEIIATDPLRQLALVRVPPSAPPLTRSLTLGEFPMPAYVIVAEGTSAGIGFRPLFVGSADRFTDARWEQPLLAVSSVGLTSPGAMIFSLDGGFLGCATIENGTLAIIGAPDVLSAAERLSRDGGPAGIDPGLAVQPLTPPLAAALGANGGVVLAAVDDASPFAGVLQSGDVLLDVDGRRVNTPEDLLVRLAEHGPGSRVTLSAQRDRQPLHVSVALPAGRPVAGTPDTVTVVRRDDGLLVTSGPDASRPILTGLRAGDLILRLGGGEAPSAAEFTAKVGALAAGHYLSAVVVRDGRTQVIAIPGRERGP